MDLGFPSLDDPIDQAPGSSSRATSSQSIPKTRSSSAQRQQQPLLVPLFSALSCDCVSSDPRGVFIYIRRTNPLQQRRAHRHHGIQEHSGILVHLRWRVSDSPAARTTTTQDVRLTSPQCQPEWPRRRRLCAHFRRGGALDQLPHQAWRRGPECKRLMPRLRVDMPADSLPSSSRPLSTCCLAPSTSPKTAPFPASRPSTSLRWCPSPALCRLPGRLVPTKRDWTTMSPESIRTT